MLLPITLTTAAACGLLNLWLGARVGKVRIAEKVFIGDGGNELVLRRMRAQANFVEYAPIILILIAALELGVGSQTWLWVASVLFVLARVCHLFGMDGGKFVIGRRIGIIVTLVIMLILSIAAAWLAKSGHLPF